MLNSTSCVVTTTNCMLACIYCVWRVLRKLFGKRDRDLGSQIWDPDQSAIPGIPPKGKVIIFARCSVLYFDSFELDLSSSFYRLGTVGSSSSQV